MKTFKEYLTAYHGTGANIEAFSLKNVGEGEGVNKYGYGLYFTSDEDIARYYANRSGSKGKVYTVDLFDRKPTLFNWDEGVNFQEAVRMSKIINGTDIINQIYQENIQNISAHDKPRFDDLFNMLLFDQNNIEAWENIKELNEDYDWNIFEKALEKAGFEFDNNDTNDSLYNYLSSLFQSDKRASDFLNRLGYDGIIYKSFELGNTVDNYVVFMEADIAIISEEDLGDENENI